MQTNIISLNSKHIIQEVILREVKTIVYSKDCASAPYSKFILIVAAIEFLGACGDTFEFTEEKQSEVRFNKGLSYFNMKYHRFAKSSSNIYLYEDLRCGLVHQLRPTSKVSLAERGKGHENLEYTKDPLKLILVLEDLYDDLEKAAKSFLKLASEGKIPNIPKNTATFLEVTSVLDIHRIFDETAAYMWFAAMAGRRTKLQLFAGIGNSSSVTNKARLIDLILNK